ncbi:protein translocase subunit SecF [Haladaptatus sp. F3-133]|jgi:preprotein translocase subunit SecF|uniref:Protein-export membrane protein SecF n=1 Tax=Halorutilus salinus TaxID=2487751 RepID=A0A9Q4C5K1_9EURY|nr:protein translocase subunit SecF [Halorutilus salinus]MCX2819482.1 protein translocase subunit SecF [Halorutilus salinus]
MKLRDIEHPTEKIDEIEYSEQSSKKLIAVPFAILGVALAVLLVTYLLTGAPVGLGFEFTGGVNIQTQTAVPAEQIEQEFSGIDGVPEPSNVRSISGGAIVSFQPLTNNEMSNLRDFRDANYADASVESVSPSHGTSLLYQSMGAIAFAFVLMTVVIFAFFRTFVPSLGIILSATSDMLVPIGVMTLLGIDVSLGTIPAILLIIGYSIDSDILLTRNTLSGRRKQFYGNVRNAMKTGVTMTTTSMAAMAVMAISAHFFSIFILRNIGIILFFGLGMDLINTYMMNVAILRWYVLDRRGMR